MKIKLNYSNKDMKKKTNDSTLSETNLNFFNEEKWNTIPVSLRARGNFRRAKCYFPPIKMKIKKSQTKNTVFNGNKSLKLVLPCRTENEKNDNILQEYIAYKIYELISPYHFKTRRVDVDFTEPKGKKSKTFFLKGFLIEDDSRLAKRFDGSNFFDEIFQHENKLDLFDHMFYNIDIYHQYLNLRVPYND